MKSEVLIVRNRRSPRLYDVVQADFLAGKYLYLEEGLDFDSASAIVQELNQEDQYEDQTN